MSIVEKPNKYLSCNACETAVGLDFYGGSLDGWFVAYAEDPVLLPDRPDPFALCPKCVGAADRSIQKRNYQRWAKSKLAK